MIRCTLHYIDKKRWTRLGRCPYTKTCSSYGTEMCRRTHELFITNVAHSIKKNIGKLQPEVIKSLTKEQKEELKDKDRLKVLHVGSGSTHSQILGEYYREKGIVSHIMFHSMTNMRAKGDMNLSMSPYLFGPAHNIRSIFSNIFNGNFRNILKYDVYHIHWGALFMPNQRDLRWLQDKLGKKVLLEWKGQDVRMWDMNRIPWLKDMKQTCTSPDLVDYSVFPGQIEWVPFGVDMRLFDDIKKKDKDYHEGAPTILHATNNWPVKGTETVLRVIKELKKEKYKFKFILNEALPYDKTIENYRKSDIIAEWINPLYGIYGTVSIENMALGNPVLCSINNQHTEWTPGCPAIDTNPYNLKEKLIYLIENPSERKKLGQKGTAYARKYHDIKGSVKRYLEIYKKL